MVARMGMMAIQGGARLNLSPGAMVRLNDVDNLRVLATKKGLLLEASNNGRNVIKLGWKSKEAAKAAKAASKAAAKAAAKGAGASAVAVHAKSMKASAKSMEASAEALAKAAKAMKVAQTASAPMKAAAGAAGAAKAGAAAGWAGPGVTLGLGLGLGALGPVVVLGALAASTGGIYFYLRGRSAARQARD